MKKIYTSPEMELLEVEIIDCLGTSIPENPAPDINDDGDNFWDNFF